MVSFIKDHQHQVSIKTQLSMDRLTTINKCNHNNHNNSIHLTTW